MQHIEERVNKLEKVVEAQQKQIQILKDLRDLQALHTDYAYLLVTRDWEKIVDLFTDDAEVILHRKGRFEGKTEIIQLFKEVTKNNRGKGRDGHLVLEPSIQVDGDKATAHWLMYIMMLDPEGGHKNMWTHGRHDMNYVRIEGKWKIKFMLFTTPWPREEWSVPTLEQLENWEKEKSIR